MQATTASETHLESSIRSETGHNSQDEEQGPHTKVTKPCDTVSPLCSSPILRPSPLVRINELDQSAQNVNEGPIIPAPKEDAIVSHEHRPQDDALSAGMSSARKLSSDLPQIDLPTLRLRDLAVQPRSVEFELTTLSKDLPSEDGEVAKETSDNGSNVLILQELASYRMAVMSLRSEAQQQAKDLRRLHQQFVDDTSSIVDTLKRGTTSDREEGPPLLSDQVTNLSHLQLNIESARKGLHQSLELLLRKEWKLKEEEDHLYARYTGKQAPSVLSDFLSDDDSDLPSVPASALSGERSVALEDVNGSAVLLQTGSPAEDAKLVFSLRAKDRITEAFMPTRTLLSRDPEAQADTPINLRTVSESSPECANAGQISPLAGIPDTSGTQSPLIDGRLMRFSKAHSPRDLALLGFQFTEESLPQLSEVPLAKGQIELTSENSSMSDYVLPKVSRWLAFGVPWSSFTRSRRHRPYRLPDGVSPWQAMAINHYGAVALGQPISGHLDVARTHEASQISATRRSLLRSWFWDPKARSDLSSASVAAVGGEAEQHLRTTRSRVSSQTTSIKDAPAAVTAPRLGGSLSPTVLLEDGGNSSAMLDRRSRYTFTAHTAQSDIAVFRRTSRGKKAI